MESFVECGCCEQYHRMEYRGDCRNDEERFRFEDIPIGSPVVDVWGEEEIKNTP